MIIVIELYAGAGGREPNKADIEKNIRALERLKSGEPKQVVDDTLLIDTIGILRGIERQLPPMSEPVRDIENEKCSYYVRWAKTYARSLGHEDECKCPACELIRYIQSRMPKEKEVRVGAGL